MANPLTAPDSVVARYADVYYEYTQLADGQGGRRVTKAVTGAGTHTHTFTYTLAPSGWTPGYNIWYLQSTGNRDDGSQKIVFTNFVRQPMLTDLWNTPGNQRRGAVDQLCDLRRDLRLRVGVLPAVGDQHGGKPGLQFEFVQPVGGVEREHGAGQPLHVCDERCGKVPAGVGAGAAGCVGLADHGAVVHVHVADGGDQPDADDDRVAGLGDGEPERRGRGQQSDDHQLCVHICVGHGAGADADDDAAADSDFAERAGEQPGYQSVVYHCRKL